MELTYTIYKTIFFYFFIMLVYRIMGKREIGQLGIMDLIVSILLAELVAISIENYDLEILNTIVPILIIVTLEIVFAYFSLKNKKINNILEGKPSLIIYNSKINYKEMVKQRYSIEDLLLSLRQKNIKTIKEVQYAFLEINGTLSVFTYENDQSYPMPIIVEGTLDEYTLSKINKTKKIVSSDIKKANNKLEDIFYGYYTIDGLYTITKEDLM